MFHSVLTLPKQSPLSICISLPITLSERSSQKLSFPVYPSQPVACQLLTKQQYDSIDKFVHSQLTLLFFYSSPINFAAPVCRTAGTPSTTPTCVLLVAAVYAVRPLHSSPAPAPVDSVSTAILPLTYAAAPQ